jgi:iron complex transport system substrate-binding protein
MRILITLFLAVFSIGCSQIKKQVVSIKDVPLSSMDIDYAKGFSVNYYDSYKELLVFSSDRKDTLHRYYLSDSIRDGFVQTPVKRLASLSSVYAAYLQDLELESVLMAVDEKDYINAPSIREEFKSREIAEIGSLEKMNHEELLLAQIDLIYSFGWQGKSAGFETKYPNTNFAYAYEYLEEEPLGRAEWIKFFACFFNKEVQADSIFKEIKSSYESLKALALTAKTKPKVLINMPFKEQWYMPGGLSYSAHFIADAGGYYPWDSLNKINSTPLDWELVYNKAYDCEYWINTGVFTSYKQVEEVLPDMNLFAAFKNKQVYNNNARTNNFGGNDYWESGLLHVDELLADLIAIFHPELLANRKLNYYKPLADD